MRRTRQPGLLSASLPAGIVASPVKALVALLLVAQPLAATIPAAAAPRASRMMDGPWRNVDDVTFNRSRIEVVPGRGARIQKMIKSLRAGESYSPEERAIMDAFNAGLPVANIEADVLISRALYNKYITREALSEEQSDLLGRYLAYTKTNASGLRQRTHELHAMYGIQISDPTDTPQDRLAWELYSNPMRFNQLDGTAHKLERRFGRKGGVSLRDLRTLDPLEATYAIPQFDFSVKGLTEAAAAVTNTMVNNPAADLGANDTQSETSILLLPGGTMLASFNDSGSYGAGSAHFTGWSRSTNSGASWTDLGKLPNTPEGDAGDPVFARSSKTGTVFFATLGFNTGEMLPVFRSGDGGATFGSSPGDGTAGGFATPAFHDKEWITVDNTGGGRSGPASGNVYMFWRAFANPGDPEGMYFTRSTDDGLTFGDRQKLSTPLYDGFDYYEFGQGAFPVVGANGAVYTFWLDAKQDWSAYIIAMRKSTDDGVTFAPQQDIQTLRTLGGNGSLGLNGGFRTNAFPQVVPHPSDPNQLFMVYNDKGISPSPDKGNIYFTQTADGGVTWSAPIQVNTDATTRDQWQPVIAITPDGGGLFVSWYDRRLDAANMRFDVYGRNATISGSTVSWGGDYRITDADSPVVIGQDPVINTTYMGDYDQATADNNFFYRTWSDNRLPLNSHPNQPDVRSAAIPRLGPGAILMAGARALTGESCTPASGAPDPGEIVTMTFAVTNNGSTATGNLVGTLQASGGVTAPGAAQTYGAVAPGATVVKTFTFTASGACGGSVTPSIQFQDGATNMGTLSYAPITLGTPIMAVATYSNSTPLAIPDTNTTVTSTIAVAPVGTVGDVNVKIRLNHTWDADLQIRLTSPNGTVVPLVLNRGGSGDNFGSGATDCTGTPTIFDDAAATAISAGAAPFVGTFRPETPLSAMNGGPANGTWTISLIDQVGLDSGTLYCWQLEINTGGGFICNPCVPSADLAITTTSLPSTNVYAGQNITYTYTITNNGASPSTDVAIGTSVPANTTFVSAMPSAGATLLVQPAVGGTGPVTYKWSGSTAAGATRTMDMTVNVNPATPVSTVISNVANALSLTVDPNGGNNSATKNVTVGAKIRQ
jgi:uncharacterized repeat protein (TIGR01451 family)